MWLHWDADDRAFVSFAGSRSFSCTDLAWEQLHIVFAHRCGKQLAQIGQRVMQVSWRANLVGVDDSTDPYLIEGVVRRMMVVFQQVLEIDRILQGSFAIGFAVDLYGLFDERQRRAGTQALRGNPFVSVVTRRTGVSIRE
jgi:hypothetical protein